MCVYQLCIGSILIDIGPKPDRYAPRRCPADGVNIDHPSDLESLRNVGNNVTNYISPSLAVM